MSNFKLSEAAKQYLALDAQRKDAALEMKALLDAAKHYGYSTKAFRAAMRLLAMTPEKRAEAEQVQIDMEDYLAQIDSRQQKEAAE